MNQLLNITVMLGGPSAERDVSLRSGAAVAAALRTLGHTVHELDPQKPDWVLSPGTDAVFLALHGTYGEDGTVQARLETLGVPYTGCGPEASRIAFDKVQLHYFLIIPSFADSAAWSVMRDHARPLCTIAVCTRKPRT